MIYRYFLLFFCFYISYFQVYAQDSNTQILSNQIQETGLPFVQNYTPNDYGAATDNWGIVQDSLGVLYFANGDGVLTYDGVSWNLIELPNSGSVLSLAIDKKGKIYVGGANEMGYLESNSIGRLNYVSLLSELPQEYHDLDNIRKIHVTDDGVIFGSETSIYKWRRNKFKVWELKSRSWTFYERGIVYVKIKGKGLMKLKDDQFKLVNDGDFFKNMYLTTLTPFDHNQLLVSSMNRLFLYDGKKFKPFFIDTPDFFSENIIYNITHLNDGTIAIGTLHNGILFIDREGHKQIVLSQKGLLNSKQVTYLFEDQSGILWATLFSGIAKIEYPSPFTFYNSNNNSPDIVVGFQRYKNKLFVASSEGLYFVDTESSNKKTVLTRVKTNFGAVNDMVIFRDKLLIGTGAGVFEINENEKVKKIFIGRTQTLYASKLDTNRIFIGLYPGLTSIYNNNGQWIEENKIEGINFRSVKLLEDKKGSLWLTTDKNEIGRISFNDISDAKNMNKPTLKVFSSKDGVPDSRGYIYIIDNEVYFKSEDDIYLFDSESQYFNSDKVLYEKIGIENRNVKINFVDKKENIWLIEYDDNDDRLDQLVVSKRDNGSYVVKKFNEKRIIDKRAYRPFPELNDSIVWYRGKPGIVRHDLKKKYNKNTVNSKTIISSVLWKNDSLLFGGYGSTIMPEFLFKNNQLRFQFASTSFYDESKNQFQYKLEGFDKDWSSWTSETKKDYTNIPEGDYSFKVRSKNIFNYIGQEDSYSFTILPPWYRTWWMYLMYGLGAIGVILLITQWRSNQLRNKNIALETIIKERTSEIVQKNRQLEDQTEQLKVVDKMKTRLFANISHEFRTPLTLIKGPIEQLEQHPEKKLSISNVKMIRRNANRLLKLVNQLLDLSKLESGNLELEPSEGNVYKCLRAAASSFSSHAAQRNMDYQIKIPPNKILWASFDRDKLEKIIYNLLSNAFKFTDDDGIVSISVKFSKEQLKIEVADSGYGIPPERLPFIFDRFFQVDDSFTKEKEGTGIGLSLTKELVELMKGTIHVESDYKEGSVFEIMIPLEEIKTAQKEDKEEFTIKIDKKEASIAIKPQNKNLHSVLIVEDNKDMRDFIKQRLEVEYQVIEAYNGQDGLEKALKTMPDLIITDLMMPKMDGISLCKQLKKEINTSHIPIIMLTAKAGIENKIEGLETGADDYLTKPFNSKELHVRIKNLIEQRQKLRELFSKKDIINPKEVTVTSLDEQFLQKIIDLLEEQYANSDYAIPQMREELAMSNAQLHRKVKALTDQSPGELLRNFRLKRAAQILKQKGVYVTEVAYDVGFNNLSYFAKCFKEFHGVSPSVFSKKNSNS